MLDSLSEHHFAHFGPKKLLDLASCRKVAPKSTGYTLSRFAFLWPETVFSKESFLVNLCLILYQSTIVHSLGRKNCLIWPRFEKLLQKVQSFLVNLCLILYQSTILHILGRKNCLIWPLVEKLLQKVQAIHCLDLHFCGQKLFFRRKVFWSTYA